MKRFLCLITCLLMAILLSSCGAQQTIDDFKYKELEDGTLKITEYKGKASNISIPETINGKTVSRIGSSCFSLDKVVSNIVLPETVTTIESSAFGSAQKLSSVTIKAKEITIENNAFSGAKLTEIKFEGETIHIKPSAFSLCTQLKALSITNAKKIIIDDSAFGSATGMKSLSLVADDIALADSAFSNCADLKTVLIKCADLSIGNSGFILCQDLESFTVDNMNENIKLQNVTIGNKCFASCGLTTFRITDGSVKIGDMAFSNNGDLTEIHVPSGTLFGEDLFQLCWKNPRIIYGE